MADKVRIELNSEGVRELLRSDDMMSICMNAAEAIKSNYGGDVELNGYVGKNRVNVSVISSFSQASENNSLLKAVHE